MKQNTEKESEKCFLKKEEKKITAVIKTNYKENKYT